MNTDDLLISAARRVWFGDVENGESIPPLSMGVEDGIVWATAKGPAVGINGYALIPAEGHPWSRAYPNGIDQEKDVAQSRANLAAFRQLTESGLSVPEAMTQFADSHPPRDTDDLDNYLNVHGGVTYYYHPWVGFDTAHLGDIWPAELDPHDLCKIGREHRPDTGIRWSHELVIEEAKTLARQVASFRCSTCDL